MDKISISFLVFASFILFQGCGQKVGPGQNTAASGVVKTSSGIAMVKIPGGSFLMGSDQKQSDEQPVHKVTIDPFLMDQYEVTQNFYEKLCGANPSHYKGSNLPVEQVSWARAALFCNARSKAEGLEPCYNEQTGACDFEANGYRLPTEAEWEYASRAESSDQFCFGNDERKLKDYGWFEENSSKKTHQVGRKKPNKWGVYDMQGNVAEWCNDLFSSDYYKASQADNPRGPANGNKQVLRGGGHSSSPNACRSSYRCGESPGTYDGCFARDDIGFRCVRSIKAGKAP